MCRLFATLSTKPVDAAFFLETASQSLLKQSHFDPKRLQADGWGVGWFEQGQPKISKSPRAIFKDRPRIHRAERIVHGPCLVGHSRWASNPLKLPKQELIGLAHSQPFQHGGWLFAHNGTLFIPREVQAELGPWAKYVKGKNDSEVLFYWLMKTFIQKMGADPGQRGQTGTDGQTPLPGSDTRRLLLTSFRRLEKIWQGCRKRYPLYKHPYHGVNIVLTNGRVLYALCYVHSGGFDRAKALCNHRQPYYQLQIQHTSHTVTVASEPLTPDTPWEPMRHGQLVTAWRQGNTLQIRKTQVFR